MSELISREQAIDAVRATLLAWSYMPEWRDNKIIEAIKRLPPIQPKRGKWIKISPANIYECSECGKNVMTNDICAYDFCHGCGAKMEVNHESN